MALNKIKLASKKYKYQQRRKQKARKEKLATIREQEHRSHRRRHAEDYVNSLRNELIN